MRKRVYQSNYRKSGVCAHNIEIHKKVLDARVCPKCKKPALEWDSGEGEAGISPYIYCSNDEVLQVDIDGKEYLGDCDFTEDDLPSVNDTGWLTHGADFDVILWFGTITEDKQREFGSVDDWIAFVRREVEKILPQGIETTKATQAV
jgi:hypothetical protein